jgi:hypothetical protein
VVPSGARRLRCASRVHVLPLGGGSRQALGVGWSSPGAFRFLVRLIWQHACVVGRRTTDGQPSYEDEDSESVKASSGSVWEETPCIWLGRMLRFHELDECVDTASLMATNPIRMSRLDHSWRGLTGGA